MKRVVPSRRERARRAAARARVERAAGGARPASASRPDAAGRWGAPAPAESPPAARATRRPAPPAPPPAATRAARGRSRSSGPGAPAAPARAPPRRALRSAASSAQTIWKESQSTTRWWTVSRQTRSSSPSCSRLARTSGPRSRSKEVATSSATRRSASGSRRSAGSPARSTTASRCRRAGATRCTGPRREEGEGGAPGRVAPDDLVERRRHGRHRQGAAHAGRGSDVEPGARPARAAP